MRVGIIQSNYLPWRGYFDFIDDVDLFVIYDDVQYTVRDWRNRNKIKTPRGVEWLSVPVHYNHTQQRISETQIDYTQPWQRKHINQIKEAYAKAPYFAEFSGELFDLLQERYDTISELNIRLIRWLMSKLEIATPLRMSSEFQPQGTKTDRLIDILKKVGASTYLSGPSAKAYLEAEKFAKAGVALEYKTYNYTEYPQLWGSFEGQVSIIDLFFNTGRDAYRYLQESAASRQEFSSGSVR